MAAVTLPTLKHVKSPNFSKRDTNTAINLIVLHDVEGGYKSAISTFSNPKSQVSAHLVVREDGLEATQMVAFSKKAWHAAAFNSRSIGIEMSGFEARGFISSEWKHSARVVAFLCKKYGIPPRWAKNGSGSGFARHYDLGAAGGGHHDPTTNLAKWLWFVALVKFEYKRGGFNTSWA